MIASPVGGRRVRPPSLTRWALLPLVLLLTGGLGFWIVSTLESSNPGLAEAIGQETPAHTAHAGAANAAATRQATASAARFTEITGLKVIRVGMAGADGILDLRYSVVDEKKANSHAGHQSVPAIIDPRTGKALTTQWMGHAHAPRNFEGDRNYWMLFLNPDELVRSGDRVAVRLGNARLNGVVVR